MSRRYPPETRPTGFDDTNVISFRSRAPQRAALDGTVDRAYAEQHRMVEHYVADLLAEPQRSYFEILMLSAPVIARRVFLAEEHVARSKKKPRAFAGVEPHGKTRLLW